MKKEEQLFNPNFIELTRLEKIINVSTAIFKSKRIVDAMISLVENTKPCLNCSLVTMFLFDKTILDSRAEDHDRIQKINVDGKWIDRIGINEKDVSDPGFKKIE